MKNILECLLNPGRAFGLPPQKVKVELREKTLTQRIAALEAQQRTDSKAVAELTQALNRAERCQQTVGNRMQKNLNLIETTAREIEELQVYTHKLSQYLQFVAAMLALALGLLLNLYLR